METFKSTDDKLKDLGFIKLKDSVLGLMYEKNYTSYRHKVFIGKKSNGDVILQSYDPDRFDTDNIGNICVALTYDELKLFIKKMEEFKSARNL